MIYAETQAKQKWCPMVRSPRIESREPIIVVAVNRPDSAVGVECIASDCMMWRFYDPDSVAPSLRQGFCGLAGKPGVTS